MSLFHVFLWKNYKYIRFHWLRTVIIFAGCLLLLLIVMASTYSENKQSKYIPEPINEELFNLHLSSESEDFICYAPNDDWLDDLMESVRRDLSIIPTRWKSFPTKKKMSHFMEEKKNTKSFFIYFDEIPTDFLTTDKGNLSYTISATHSRISTSQIYYNDRDVVGMQNFDDYTSSGFFALQHAIDQNYAEKRTGKRLYPIEIAPFPRTDLWDIDNFRLVFFGLLYMLFLYIIILTTFIVPLVEEKQDGMQSYLSIATGHSWINRFTFYLIRLGIYFLFTSASLAIAKIYNGMGSIGFIYFFVLYILFLLSTLSYAFLISIFLKSVNFAKIGGFLAFFVPTILFSIESSVFHRFACLISGNVFLKGLETFQIFTNKRREFGVADLIWRVTDNSSTIAEVYVKLLAQLVVYTLLYAYLTNIFPGFGGVRKPFYYIFQIFGSKKTTKDSSTSSLTSDIPIQIIDLVKVYGGFKRDKKVVVDNLKMDVEKNKITVLLGHNGAGKTTTINMIIGSVEKTSGQIAVFGERNVEDYRSSIGYCPQHNIFMQYLTCKEHIYLFSRLRGQTDREAENEAANLLSELLIKEKANEVGENLSGGMKRRLALGMAIAGNTSIAVLDEPTSGLDPESRRTLWDILLKLRKTRSILITTHYMEEAEILGDEIAIMSQGKLVCKGSCMDLKREHGSGYILKLLVGNNFNENTTLNYIQGFIGNASKHSFVKPTFCVNLAYADRALYSRLLASLDRDKHALGVLYVSVANSSLEDVFLNCAEKEQTNAPCTDNTDFSKVKIPYKRLKNSGKTSYDGWVLMNQIFGIVFKKGIYLRSKWIYTLIMCLFPLVTIGITFWIMNADTSYSEKERAIDLQINIPNSEIYIKMAPGYSDFEKYLDDEIRRYHAFPIYIAQHESLEETLLSLQDKDITHFYDRIFGAFELTLSDNEVPTVKVLYSSNIVHSSVTLLNLIDNVLLKYNSKSNISILTRNAPLARSIVVSPARLEYFSSIVPIGCFFYMLFYVSLPFRERRTQFSKLQNISRTVYWITFTLFDVLFHILICSIVYLAIFIFDSKHIYNSMEIMQISTTIIWYGMGYLPILYILSNSFRSISTLSTYLFLSLIIATIVPIITSANEKTMESYGAIISIFMLIPDFALKHQLIVINENYFIHRRNALKGENNPQRIPDLPLNISLFYFYMGFVFAISLTFLISIWDNIYSRERIKRIFSLPKCNKQNRTKTFSPQSTHSKDHVDSVERGERTDGVDEVDGAASSLLVTDLHKFYGCSEVHAVRGIDFSVKEGECFGLLGLNGAGKSSTFEMITGNEPISKGCVSIKDLNINAQMNQLYSHYGYCPQVDALNGFMTSHEILTYVALLRGIPLKEITNEVNYWLKELDLEAYQDVPIKYYSGGTKRKLNTAMAMIGDPDVIFLDEPTTGVDPKSRRFMWKCIQDFQKNKKTIVLTSHSMDECENLCNRLAIMVQGKIQCDDSIPKLKKKFGDKFTITLRLVQDWSNSDFDALKQELYETFQCTEREFHDLTIVYSVKAIPWHEVFHKMENIINKHSHILYDYCVNETTLEDIFLNMKS